MKRAVVGLFAFVAGLLLWEFGRRDMPAAGAAETGVAPEAKEVLSKWFDGLQKAKTVACDTKAAFSVKQLGKEIQADSSSHAIAVERPDKFSATLKTGDGATIVNDGKKLYEYLPENNIYTIGEGKTSLTDLIEKSVVLSKINKEQGLSILGDALASESLDKFLENFQSVEYVGLEEADGAKRHHLRGKAEELRTDWWFDAEPVRLHAVAPVVADLLEKSGRQLPEGIELSMKVTFADWSYDQPAAATTFSIAPPKDAELVDDLFGSPATRLVGKPVPAFEAVTLKDEKIKPADFRGKVVVLDFWATWCPPCVRALPIVNETTAKYKDKGVVFFAVNCQEEPGVIKEFLASQKLEVPVALDSDGKISAQFRVEGIPQTVIVDREGVIRKVHVGAGPTIGDELSKELDEILAAKKDAP